MILGIFINIVCFATGFYVGPCYLRIHLGKSDQLSAGIGIFTGFGLVYLIGLIFHVNFYLNFAHAPVPWNKLHLFLGFAIIALIYSAYRYLKETFSKRSGLSHPNRNRPPEGE